MSNYGFSNLESSKIPFPVSDCVNNVELHGCTYGTHGNYEFIDFTYKRKTDEGVSTLIDRMFALNEKMITPNASIEGDTKEAALKREYAKFATRLKHIATKFGISEDELKAIPEGNFAVFAKTYCNLVNARCSDVMLYCKTVKDKSGYCKMAKYPSFLQRMDVGKCELKYSATEVALITANTPANGAAKESRMVDWVSKP